jgi:hypothetical protein
MIEVGQRWRWDKIGDIFIITEVSGDMFFYRYETGSQKGRDFDSPITQHMYFISRGSLHRITPLMEALL